MDKDIFKRILFKIAFCTMACDGDIDDREIEEIELMGKKANYFVDIDLTDELKTLVDDFHKRGVGIIEKLFDELSKVEFNPIQELLILEVAIRVIYADKKVDENEIKFFKYLRSKLRVPNEIIADRFGDISDIYDLNIQNKIVPKTSHEIDETFELPDISDLKEIDFKKSKS
ncbi:TerB family tellurite resistance protein [Lentimicrobium sp. S6]|uniref:tellurite resistance TerB family protein n=1 Tax=Lentimicrobium sp. S6 TaxID=2735872 RepID=UPI00155436AD|nr:TerB family tellurite resistance protein [Lentimicrobium sp. S6]NPD47246.1 TerB family tellurite resistance protein [Lentimicrobium sp. S6]